MRSVLISILLILSVLASGQLTRAYAYQVTPVTSSNTGAESIWLCENDGSDEKDNNTISLYGTASWTNSTYKEGSYSLDADCGDCGVTVPPIDYTSSFSIAGEMLKWGGTDNICIMSTLQSNNGWSILYDPVNHRLGFQSGNGTTTATEWTASIGGSSGVWFMFGFVVNYDNGTVHFYLDGADGGDGSITYTPSTYTSTARIGVDFSNNQDSWAYFDAIQVYTWELTLNKASTINTTPGTEVTQ